MVERLLGELSLGQRVSLVNSFLHGVKLGIDANPVGVMPNESLGVLIQRVKDILGDDGDLSQQNIEPHKMGTRPYCVKCGEQVLAGTSNFSTPSHPTPPADQFKNVTIRKKGGGNE